MLRFTSSSSSLRVGPGVTVAPAAAAETPADALAAVVQEAAGTADAGQNGAKDEHHDDCQNQQEPPGHPTLAPDVCMRAGDLRTP